MSGIIIVKVRFVLTFTIIISRTVIVMRKRNNTSGLIIKTAAVSALTGTAVFFSVSVFFSLVLYLADAPYHTYRIASELTIAAGSFAAGRTGGICSRKKGIFTGGLCSMLIFIPALILFMFLSEDIYIPVLVMTFTVSAVSGAAGGVIGVNRHITGKPVIYKEYE